MPKATFLLTFDTELLWDLRGRPWTKTDLHAVECLREKRFSALLKMLDELSIPATFALVGHLLSPASAVEIPRKLREEDEWYESLAPDLRTQERGLYWPELISLLKNTQLAHEIGCHTLTHRLFDEASLSQAAAQFEIEAACRIIGEAFGRRPTALVFPRNLAGHLSIAAKNGIRVFRGKDPTWWNAIPGWPGKLGHLVDRSLALTPPVHRQPYETNGLINVPGSMLLLARSGLRRLVPLGSLRRQAIKGLEVAIREGAFFHLWLHPIDLGYDDGELLAVLRAILERAANAVQQGFLHVTSRSAFADSERKGTLGHHAHPSD
ncbi:MAG: polysaccharide deacetylase family protein [Candidatus Zipacnadales bacterium]